MAEPMTLLPCPFCGSEPEISGKDSTMIECSNDQCVVVSPCPFNDFTHRGDAINAWNTRSDATITALQSELRDVRERLARVGELAANIDAKPIPDNRFNDYLSGVAGGECWCADQLHEILDEQSATIPGNETRATI